MHAPTEKEVRAVAEALRAQQQRHLPRRGLPVRPSGLARTKIAQRQRADQNLMSLVERAGVRRAELDRFRTDRLDELRRLRDDQRGATADATARAAAAATAALASRRAVEEHLARHRRAHDGGAWNLFVLDEPFLVLPTGDIDLDSVTKAPQNTVARCHATWETPYPDNALDFVNYWFVWQNPSDANMLVNVWSIMALDGFADALAGPGNDITLNGASVVLYPFEWWNQPPTTPQFQYSQADDDPATLIADGGGPFGTGDYESTLVSGAFDVSYRQWLIPPRGVAVIAVSLSVIHEIHGYYPYDQNGGGYADIDFASDSRQMMCPAVLITSIG